MKRSQYQSKRTQTQSFHIDLLKPEQTCHPIPNKRPKTTPFCVLFFPQLSQQPNESFKALPRKPRSSNQSSIISAKTTITMKNNNNEANLFKRSTG